MGDGQECHQRSSYIRTLPEGCRRAEDKANTALREGAAERGHTARHPHSAHREAPRRGYSEEGGKLLQRRPRLRDTERRPAKHLRGAGKHAEPGPRHSNTTQDGRTRRRDSVAGSVAIVPRASQERHTNRQHRPCGQVRPAGRIQVDTREPLSRRHIQRP